ncbi:hypothetical protein [Candidatus Chlamydia sanziniae]|uniref:Putative outer membrane leader peptide n=1 Tax=Candidatus Chlamydia sanziniae TaxID=1806891 RepID=A0A1A9HU01_9CHLA|nr:hypothetical protein [Candidatus Chlamydia sanziniae]ANH78469.1 putative outer membrane leader peptide [Candidatus Chlamydia sanziniae]
MKKLFLYFSTFIASLFCGVFLWERVPCAHKVMQLAGEHGAEVFSKSCHLIRKISGLEQLEVFERHISVDQALALFPEYRNSKSYIELNFIPHTLMHVRFSKEEPGKKHVISQEGEILWSLVNGEMVLNTTTWACSKGFRECLLLHARKQDMQVMQTLASLGGAASKESLSQALAMRNIPAEKVIKECHKKKLIFTSNSYIGTHFQQLQPIQGCTTTLHTPRVWLQKPRHSMLFPAQYSEDRVCRLVKMIFGENFLILRNSIVYVPVYKVFLVSIDNSVRIEYVNAITGKPFYNM